MLASSTWAVQMLEVAFSRRMCCSRVWSAILNAVSPWRSWLTPMMRPGILRANASVVAKNAACGPPNPIGTPKRWLDPSATSAPQAPGASIRVSAKRSVATARYPPDWWTASASAA